MSEKIIYPSIDLFLYDLKDGLGQNEEKIKQNCEQFCQKLYHKDELDTSSEEFQERSSKIKKYQDTEADVIELLDTRIKEFKTPLDGYYYPLQIGDTYALRVDYSGKLNADGKANDDEQEIGDRPFERLKQEIENHIGGETGTIGQSWLIWGKLKDDKKEAEVEEIAKDCYTQIASNYLWERDFIGKGSLLGGTVFELWYSANNLGGTGKEFWDKFRKESHHVLIWLFPYDKTADEMRKAANSVYYDFLRLFQYRHKIVWAYYQSRNQKNKLKKEFVELQKWIDKVPKLPDELETEKLSLRELQKTLTDSLNTVSKYTVDLNYLDDQGRNIKTNKTNYKYRLGDMIGKYQGSDLEFLKKFSDSEIYAEKYQRQVETEHANLSPGLTVLQNLTSTISGIIGIEQAKSDRALNSTVAIAGTALAISGVTAGVVSISPPATYKDLSFLLSPAFVLCIASGLIPVFIASIPWIIRQLFRRKAMTGDRRLPGLHRTGG